MENISPIYLNNLKSFHERLSYVLDLSKYSNSDISKKLNTSNGNISKLKNGTTKSPGYEKIKELCDLLDINPNFLFGYSNVPFRKTYADAVVEYMAPLDEASQRIVVRNVRMLVASIKEEKIEFGLGPI